MKFRKSSTRFGWVQPVDGINPNALRELLPKRLQADTRADAFLRSATSSACTFANLVAGDGTATPEQLQQAIERVGKAAHAMHNELVPLAGASEATDLLNVHFKYLRWRARQVGVPAAGRPTVPTLPADVPKLAELLDRVAADLRTLRVACEYTAAEISPIRSAPKTRERNLVHAIVVAYQQAFGELPPKRRTWFVDQFMQYIGERLSVQIGHRVVGDVIDSMRP